MADKTRKVERASGSFVAVLGDAGSGRELKHLARAECVPGDVFELTAYVRDDGESLARGADEAGVARVYVGQRERVLVLTVRYQVAEWLPLSVDATGEPVVERLRLHGAKYQREVISLGCVPEGVRQRLCT